MARIPIALELYSVREDLSKDLRGTLKQVAKMGYEGVEFAGHPEHSPEEYKAALDEAGLVCCSWHTPIDQVQPDKLAATIALNKAVGNRSLIIPGLPGEYTSTKEAWLKTAALFNELTDKLAAEGMFTGYHNHHTEFQPMDGSTPWDIFFGATRKEVVTQLDTGNARYGGADPVSLLEAYPGRAISVHLKPFSSADAKGGAEKGYEAIIGQDDSDWEGIFRVCETTGGTQWYIVEYESSAYPPLEAVERCLKALKGMGK
ncbi:MAG TPA: sugar phosphate isomerase/epimerase [Armatimonadota bacterium]|jgi:sugar phosphate isomerase/epimerase